MNNEALIDYNDWWDDLTIEQKRAVYFLWLTHDIKAVYYQDFKSDTDNTTHSNMPTVKQYPNKSYFK